MLEKFTLMCKDVEVGIIEYDTEKEKFSFTLNENIDNTKYLPPILYDYTNLSQIINQSMRMYCGG